VSLNPATDASVDGRQLAEYGVGTHRCLPIAITAANLAARIGQRQAGVPVLGAASTATSALREDRSTS
jgi:hypothetical protein